MHKQRAQMLVEFAIIAPVMILLALGILGFGRAFYTYVDLANAARSGARYAVSQAAQPCNEAQVRLQVQSAQPNLSIPSAKIALDCSNGNRRTVTITDYQFDTMTYFLGTNGVIALSTSATMPLVS